MAKKKVVPPPVHFAGMPAAVRCMCPEAACTRWRASKSKGGGHVSYARAMELLAAQRKARR